MSTPTDLPTPPRQSIYEVFEHQKVDLLLHMLENDSEFTAVMVFVRTRDAVNALTSDLRHAGVRVESILGHKKPELRARALKEFAEGKIRVLVATDSSARAGDIQGVSHVVNCDFFELDSDYQLRLEWIEQSGGTLVNFATLKDGPVIERVEALVGGALPRIVVDDFVYDTQDKKGNPNRGSGKIAKGTRFKPLQNKKPKFKKKRGRK